MNSAISQRILPLLLIALGVVGCLYFAFDSSENSKPSNAILASDSINSLCDSAMTLIASAPADDAAADIPGDAYIKACEMIDSSKNIAHRHNLPTARIDSLRSALTPALRLTIASIDARLKVVEGIAAAESPLLRRRAIISATLGDSIHS